MGRALLESIIFLPARLPRQSMDSSKTMSSTFHSHRVGYIQIQKIIIIIQVQYHRTHITHLHKCVIVLKSTFVDIHKTSCKKKLLYTYVHTRYICCFKKDTFLKLVLTASSFFPYLLLIFALVMKFAITISAWWISLTPVHTCIHDCKRNYYEIEFIYSFYVYILYLRICMYVCMNVCMYE